jgi:DNA polymerase III subunit gamma/tau
MPADAETAAPYRVLARKYRPRSFADVIGQDAMVRTLTNAIAAGRLAHAFMLTGVRGVGKTTTARIIARALNCVGPDGKGGPTAQPCGQCDNCIGIAEDRHLDVIEMDAASRSKVEEMRELLDGVRYRPANARYKVYIIDEVHMLSPHAFNALLKTLEEPPEHVKFIFATTEIRKVPVTVLSRCQRFDLRRVDTETLTRHFLKIAGAEGVKIALGAVGLIARAADGSVRDGLSLLDQAIARTEGEIGEADVRDMLGLADRVQIFDLFDGLMKGDTKGALDLLAAMYAAGADPSVVIQDLLDLTHWLTRVKLVAEVADAPGVPEAERVRGKAMAEKLSIPLLSRCWQMLLKGLGEVQTAPQALQAAEMVLIRLTHAASLPPPADLVRQLQEGAGNGAAAPQPPAGRGGASPSSSMQTTTLAQPVMTASRGDNGDRPRALAQGGTAMMAAPGVPAAAPSSAVPAPDPKSYEELVALLQERREAILYAQLHNNVHLVRFEPGRLEIRPEPQAPANLANRLGALLGEWTGRRWVVSVSSEPGDPTLAQQKTAGAAKQRAEIEAHPLVQAAMKAFPGATIDSVRSLDLPADTPTDGEIDG